MTSGAGANSPPGVVGREIRKHFGDIAAVDGVSFEVRAGEIFGILGPDGAGKTTLLRILTTLLVPDGGEARVLGLDPVADLWRLRPLLGYMPGRFSLYPDLSVEENLRFFASVFGTNIEREYELIAPIYRQIEPFKHRRAGALSGGMKQKLALSCALVHRPRILILDEPTTGVDAVSRREFWELLAHLRDTGLTILVTTPYMDEASRCNRVALMQRGRLLAIDAPQAVPRRFEGHLFAVSTPDRYAALLALRTFSHHERAYPFGESLHYVDRRRELAGDQLVRELGSHLRAAGIEDVRIAATPPNIEDTFIALLSKESGGGPEGP